MNSRIELSLRGFDAAVQSAYTRLFAGDPDKSAAALEWRSSDNPHGPSKFAIATDGYKVVGMIALIPTRLIGRTGALTGYQAVDTAVDPDYRGQGLFVKLGTLAQAELAGDVLWGFPNANAAPGWYGRLGWTNFGSAPLLMRPLRAGFLFGRLHPRLRAIDFPLVSRPLVDVTEYSDGARLADDFDPLWQTIAPSFGTTVDRSSAWVRWRLFDKPGGDYRCVGRQTADGSLGAFVATKLADKHGSRLCYVMEALSLPERTAELGDIIRSEISHAAARGAEAALAWCDKRAPSYAAYRRAGYVPVPTRVRPIEINFGARALRAEAAAAAAPDAAWYVSFLDSDTN